MAYAARLCAYTVAVGRLPNSHDFMYVMPDNVHVYIEC